MTTPSLTELALPTEPVASPLVSPRDMADLTVHGARLDPYTGVLVRIDRLPPHIDDHLDPAEQGLPWLLGLGILYPLRRDWLDGTFDHFGFSRELREILDQNLLARRAAYANALHTLWRAVEPPMVSRLHAERYLWTTLDEYLLRRRVYPYLVPGHDFNEHNHWLWEKPGYYDRDRPSVSWLGYRNVPVHRLLWATFRPTTTLLRETERPRKRDICPDRKYRNCVNPSHFELGERGEPAPNPRTLRGKKDEYPYKPLLKNCETYEIDGKLQVVCPVCSLPLSAGSQRQVFEVPANLRQKQGYCGRCHRKHEERYGKVVHERNYATRVEPLPSAYQNEVHMEWDKIMLEQERERNRLPMPDDSGEVLDTD